ncbi:proline-rich receptor-like protein kinase PERK7 [Cryptomeria japonica]|uniref:proline-rich receptor-like protein kinase PERK7 n=1 Tax=Cryptomeria japonica TaxID=3369 RepID=UPI0027DA04C5|nr:proline-rich receptor-like protein kinase PERK7 [Cryptomeria japonica]
MEQSCKTELYGSELLSSQGNDNNEEINWHEHLEILPRNSLGLGFLVQIGSGGFGIVFRGILPNGRHVAVKVLRKESLQGKVVFLHEGEGFRIMHKDIKPTGILLDENLNAKISDFGFAQIQLSYYEDISIQGTRIVGTFGYAAPEYSATVRASLKSDIAQSLRY